MAESVGSLFLEYGIDPTLYNRQLEQMRVQALTTAKVMERQFSQSFKGGSTTFRPLKPTVDHTELIGLNRHIDEKQKHWGRAQRDFSKPLRPAVDFTQLNELERRLNRLKNGNVSVNVSASGSSSQSSRSSADQQFADLIGKAVAKHSKGQQKNPSVAQRVLNSPFRAAGFAASQVASGLFMDIGANISRGAGASRLANNISRGAGQTIGKTIKFIDRHVIDTQGYIADFEDYLTSVAAEFLRTGDLERASKVQAKPQIKIKQSLARLQRMAKIATLADNMAEAANIPELAELVPATDQEVFRKNPEQYLRKNRRVGVAVAKRAQTLLAEVKPQEFLEEFLNPVMAQFAGVSNLAATVRAKRAVFEAKERIATGTNRPLPDLQEGEEGYVQMIGGAMFRRGYGNNQLTPAFEGMYPGRRVVGINNPDTDPGDKPASAVVNKLYDFFKKASPDIAGNQEMANTIINALTMLTQSFDPTFSSKAVEEAVTNILAAKQAGVDPSKFSTVSYSLGGQEARGIAETLDLLGLDSKTLSMAFPDINAGEEKLPNYRSTLIEEDPLGFAKSLMQLGTPEHQRVYKAGVPASAAAHAYKHYFKNQEQVTDFYSHLGIEQPGGMTDAPKFLNQASQYYETIGSARQVEALFKTGKFDEALPLKAFGGENTTGSGVLARLLEANFKMVGGGDDGLNSVQKAVKAKFIAEIQRVYQVVLDGLIEAGENIEPDTKAADLYGRIKFNDELPTYNASIQSFKTGVVDEKAYFAGELDPIKVKQRLADVSKARAFFAKEDTIPDASVYKKPILKMFDDLKMVMTEFAEAGRVSEATLAKVDTIQSEKFSETIDNLLRAKLDSYDLPEFDPASYGQTFLQYFLQYEELAKELEDARLKAEAALKKQAEKAKKSTDDGDDDGPKETRKPLELPLALRETEKIAVNAVEAVGGAIVKATANVAAVIQDRLEDYVVGRMNSILMRVPGQPNTLDASRQIGGIDEIDLSDIFKATMIGVEDTARGTLQILSQTYAVAKGTEEVLFKSVPLLGAIGGFGKHVAVPIGLGVGMTNLPGIGGALGGLESLMADALGSALAAPGIAGLDALGAATGGAMLNATNFMANVETGNFLLNGAVHALGNAGSWTAGNAVLPAGEAIGGVANAGINLAAQGIAHVTTPLLAGQSAMGGVTGMVESVLTPEQLQANRQLQAEAERKLAQLKGAIKTAEALLPASPNQANAYLASVKAKYPELQGEIDQAIKALPAAQRMQSGGGAELAQLKSQLSQALNSLDAAENRAAKLGQFIEGVTQILQLPGERMQRNITNDVIEAEVIDVTPNRPKPTQRALPSSNERMQSELDRVVKSVEQQIAGIGKEFSEQIKNASREGVSPTASATVAASIEQLAEEAKAAIDAVMASLGENATASIKRAAKSSRASITRSANKAQSMTTTAQETGVYSQAEGMGVNIAEGTNEGIQSRIDALIATAEAMAQAVILAVENKLEIRSPSRVFQRIGEMVMRGFELGFEGQDSVRQKLGKEAEEFATAFKQGLDSLGITSPNLIKLVDFFENNIGGALQGASNLAKGLLSNAAAVVGFGAAALLVTQTPIIPFLQNLGLAAIEAAENLERIEARFDFNFGSNGAEQFQSVTERAVELRQNINDVRQGYLQFANAVKGTPLEFSTDAAQQALGKASLTQGLTREEMQRTQTAIIQSAGKGQLYSEEVFGQLAEALPNAPAVLARSIGTDISGLRARMQSGLPAEDVLPKFFAQLEAESSLGVDAALETTTAKAANLENQITLLQEALGKELLPAKKMGLDVLAGAAQVAAVAIGPLMQLATAGALLAFGPMILKITGGLIANTAALAANAAAALIWGRSYAGAGAAAGNFAKIMNSPAMKGFGLTTAIFAGIEGIKLIMGYFKDGGGAAKEFADQMDKAAENYAKAMGKLKEKPDPMNGTTQLEQYFGEGYGKKTMRHFENSLMTNPLGFLSAGIIKQTPKFMQFQTYGEKQQKDQERAMERILAGSDRTMAEMDKMLQSASRREGPLFELSKIQKEMRQRQTERRMLAPTDSVRRKEIDDRIAVLSVQRQPIEQEVRMLSGLNATDIEGLKRQRDTAFAEGSLGDYDKYNRKLDEALKKQAEFNAALEKSVTPVSRLAIEFDRIANKLTEANRAVDVKSATERTEVAADLFNGTLTQGQAEYKRFAQEQSVLAGKIENNNIAIADSLEKIGDVETQRVMSMSGFNSQSSPAEIRAKAAMMPDNGPEGERARLEQTATELEKIEGYRLDTANMQAQMAESQANARQQLIDASKQIEEFYRGIARSAEQTALTVERMNLESATLNAKTKLQGALTGFQNRFFGSFVNGVIELVDMVAEKTGNSISAAEQTLQLKFNQQDTARQGDELGRTTFGGSAGYSPYTTHRQYFIDDSPVGSYDYTLEQNGNFNPALPSPVSGVVTETGNDAGGYGNWVAVKDSSTGMEHFFAHLKEVSVKAGQQVVEGMGLGLQGTTGSSTGEHIHHEIYNQPRSQGGQRITDRGITQPIVEAYLARLERGATASAPTASASQSTGNLDQRIAQAVAIAIPDLKQSEGFRANAYDDGTGVRTIGYGETNPAVVGRGSISEPEAARLMSERLVQDFLKPALELIPEATRNQLTSGQMAAIGSFAYNTGIGGFQDSSFGSALIRGDIAGAQAALPTSYINPGTNVEQGLRNRRQRELAMFTGGSGSGGGMPQPNTELIGQGVGLNAESIANQQAAINQNLTARDAQSVQQTRLKIDAIREGIINETRALEDVLRDAQRRQQDAILESVPQTASIEFGRRMTQLSREYEDNTRNLTRTIEEAQRGLDEAKRTRDIILESGSEEQRSLLPEAEAAIADQERYVGTLKEVAQAEQDIYNKRKQFAEDEFRRPMTEAREASRFRSAELDLQERASTMRDSGLQSIVQSELGTAQIYQRYAEQLKPLRREAEATAAQLDRLKAEGISLDAPEAVAVAEQLSFVNEQLATLERQRDQEINISINQRQQAFQDYQRGLQGQLVEAQASYMDSYGSQFEASALREQQGFSEENFRYENQIASIDSLAQSGLYSADAIANLRIQAEMLHEVNLGNIDQQFKDLGETLAGMGQNAFGSFFGDILQGKDALESLKSALSGLLSQLADLAVQTIFRDLFAPKQATGEGGIFGALMGGFGATAQPAGGGLGGILSFIGGIGGGGMGGAAAAGGGMGGAGGWMGLASTALSLIGGMAEGGMVEPGNFEAYRQGNDPIARALRREGTGAVLAALTPGERVLSVKENQRFERLGMLQQVRNFAEGGRVGGVPAPEDIQGMGGVNVNVSVPVTVQGGGNAEGVDLEKLRRSMKEDMKKTAYDVINKEHRPGGAFDRSKKGR